MIRDLNRTSVRPAGVPRRRGLAALLAAGGVALTTVAACGPSTARVTQGTAGATGCSQQDLVVFNYDKGARSWLAACQQRLFVCSPGSKQARCVQQDPAGIDPALAERIEILNQVPPAQREALVHFDVSAQDWDGFAKTVASVNRLRPAQVTQVDDPRRLFTDFSAEFDAALTQCLGPDGVARVDVSASGGLTVAPNKPCLVSLRGAQDLAELRLRPGQSFYLASGVRAVEPVQRPGTEEPEPEEPEVSPLEIAVRDWLDANATDILACTNTDKAVINVHVDEEGQTTVSLRDELAETAAEGCVRSALPERTFEEGAGEVVHLVRPPTPDPDTESDEAGEEAAAPKEAPKSGPPANPAPKP